MRREIKLMMMIKMAELLKCFVKLDPNKEKKKKKSKSGHWEGPLPAKAAHKR